MQRLAQQIPEQMDLDPAVTEHVREPVVLGAGAPHPQHVVEEEVVLVGRGEPLEFEIGPVEDHSPQAPGLGIDVECHAAILP